jgi:N-methylhydantoinase B
MTMTKTSTPSKVKSITTDPIGLEVLRNRLEAIADDAGTAVERTAVSTIVNESHDYSATILDVDGKLIVGGGQIPFHFGAAVRSVQATIEKHCDTLEPGDVFLANDPHNGGGLHQGDVFVSRPVYAFDRVVAWVAMSAHMMDTGGLAPGSFAPAATECYAEGIRFPPVRIFRAGVEVKDSWDIFLNNVRMAPIVEMDLRSLVAGGHVVQEKLSALVEQIGHDEFIDGVAAIRTLSENEMRRRIGTLQPGRYKATRWAEWGEALYEIPCTLTVFDDHLEFDFEGAAPQTPHFFNSKPYIIKAVFMPSFSRYFAPDLPFNQGMMDTIDIKAPKATIVNCEPPAPTQAGHVAVAFGSAELMMQCVNMAIFASDAPIANETVSGWSAPIGFTTWTGLGVDGSSETWVMMLGGTPSAGGTLGSDGRAGFTGALQGGGGRRRTGTSGTDVDIEVIEMSYPILVKESTSYLGTNGAGEWRAGASTRAIWGPHGSDRLTGETLASGQWMPSYGAAGGYPGANTRFYIHHPDGTKVQMDTNASGMQLRAGEQFEGHPATGGGVGDPLDRAPDAVAVDIAQGLMSAEDAFEVYGVVFEGDKVDGAATSERRDAIRAERLARAVPAPKPTAGQMVDIDRATARQLFPGVVQLGSLAVAERSGVVLATSPDHWTEGCPTLEERRAGDGPALTIRSYLDPKTGQTLHVEAVPAGHGRAFEVMPASWTAA